MLPFFRVQCMSQDHIRSHLIPGTLRVCLIGCLEKRSDISNRIKSDCGYQWVSDHWLFQEHISLQSTKLPHSGHHSWMRKPLWLSLMALFLWVKYHWFSGRGRGLMQKPESPNPLSILDIRQHACIFRVWAWCVILCDYSSNFGLGLSLKWSIAFSVSNWELIANIIVTAVRGLNWTQNLETPLLGTLPVIL